MSIFAAPRKRLLIADDHALIRRGLRVLLESDAEFEVVAEAADGCEALALAREHKPDIAVLDIGMPRLNGIDCARQLSEHMPEVRVIAISLHSDETYVLGALKAGVRGYILKGGSEGDVISALRAVAAGNAYFSPEISRLLVEEYVREIRRRGVEDSYDLLSIREKEVFNLLVSGHSNRQIADMIHLSQATVETHRNNIFQKVNVHSLADLVRYAARRGLISGSPTDYRTEIVRIG